MLHTTNNPSRSVCLLVGMHTHAADKETLQNSFSKMSRWCNCSNISWECFACTKMLFKALLGIFCTIAFTIFKSKQTSLCLTKSESYIWNIACNSFCFNSRRLRNNWKTQLRNKHYWALKYHHYAEKIQGLNLRGKEITEDRVRVVVAVCGGEMTEEYFSISFKAKMLQLWLTEDRQKQKGEGEGSKSENTNCSLDGFKKAFDTFRDEKSANTRWAGNIYLFIHVI